MTIVRESGDGFGLITRQPTVRVRARSCRATLTPSTRRTPREGRTLFGSRGRTGFDGSVRQQCSSGSRPTALAQPGNLKCERERSFRDAGVHRGGSRRARGLRECRCPGRRVTAPTWRTARKDELTRAGKDGALVEGTCPRKAGRRHGCTAWSDAGSTPAGSTLLTRSGGAR
jgi:hypothetical protein